MKSLIFICKNVPCKTNFFISTVFSDSPTDDIISQESVMDSFVVLLHASLFQVIGQIIFSVSWKFPTSLAVRSSLLDDVIWNCKKVQCVFNETSICHCFFEEMPACAINDALTSMIGMLCTAVWGPSQAIQTVLHCPRRESSVLTLLDWFCRRSC